MADPNHPRKFTEEFRRQIVQLYLAGKPRGELMAEYDLGSSTLFRWIKCRSEAGVCLLAGPHDREIVGHAASGRKDARIAAASSRTPISTTCRRRSISGGPSPARATRATTRSSSPPTGS